jgi:hypothetical protein
MELDILAANRRSDDSRNRGRDFDRAEAAGLESGGFLKKSWLLRHTLTIYRNPKYNDAVKLAGG